MKKIISMFQPISLMLRNKPERKTPEDREYDSLREDMRGQFEKLRDKGLSIRIVRL